MASSVTSAGVASGIDFESIISASVSAKRTQLQSSITKKKTNANIELTGVGKLKSALSNFKDVLDDVSKKNSFNKRTVSINQDSSDKVFTVSTKEDASNGNYNITVTQLSASTAYSTTVADSTEKLGAGKLTFSIGSGDDEKSFTVDVDEEDTLETLRKKINQESSSFGVNANILTLADGSSKFVLDSGNTGEKYSNFTITSEGSDKLKAFEANLDNTSGTGMQLVRKGVDAKIEVDGAELTSENNVFDDKIKGLKIEVKRLSDTETITEADGSTTTGYKSNKLSISTDTGALKSMVESFINTYNGLRDTLDSLSKRNTYTNGQCNDDGGYLAGDSTCSTIKSTLSNMLSSFSIGSSDCNNIFTMGFKMDNNGKLSLDSEKFDEIVDNNYEQLVAMFSGDNSISKKMSETLDEYTKSGGVLDKRTDSLNSDIKSYENKSNANDVAIEKYESALRAKYSSLDTLIANLNTSLSYLSSAMSVNNSNNNK
ncbi:MAG: flagellar filament capping protein FliD [Succinivibrionaceae bacterium]